MAAEPRYVESNDRERKRMRGLIERLTERDLRSSVTEHRTAAGMPGTPTTMLTPFYVRP